VDYRLEVARIRKGKEDARKQKAIDDALRLSKVVLISSMEAIMQLTVVKMGHQIDAFRFRGLPDVPAKSRFPNLKKTDRQTILKQIFQQYQQYVAEKGPLPTPVVDLQGLEAQIMDDWEADEEAEMEE
jgi:hypothetical protein